MILRECTNLKRIPVSFLAEFVLKLPILKNPYTIDGYLQSTLKQRICAKTYGTPLYKDRSLIPIESEL
ncbi:hypothetical protein LEP1GSC076_3746 [Leptospira sp. Fiocruz LV4135]|nr:hypothetical protein LEP1GSC076_3746 [Leptospira sp. Fiocruz LV4135]